jgi:hypothetical protein
MSAFRWPCYLQPTITATYGQAFLVATPHRTAPNQTGYVRRIIPPLPRASAGHTINKHRDLLRNGKGSRRNAGIATG